MNQRERKKNDGIIGIMFCLILVAYTAKAYNLSHDITTLCFEVACILLLFAAILSYLKMREPEKPKKVKAKKKAKPKAVTPFDKKFKKNYAKTQRKQKTNVQISDKKTAYIESAWNELNKI